jgi:hypothetical protein
MTVLTKSQKIRHEKRIRYDGRAADLIVTIRHDDECGNGHNSFSVTGEIYRAGSRRDADFLAGGCIHEEIARAFPEIAPFIKWHLMTTDGVTHYVANTLYFANGAPATFNRFIYLIGAHYGGRDVLLGIYNKPAEWARVSDYFAPMGAGALRAEEKEATAARAPDIEAARACAIWPGATLEQLRDENALKERAPFLAGEFRAAVESLGFIF